MKIKNYKDLYKYLKTPPALGLKNSDLYSKIAIGVIDGDSGIKITSFLNPEESPIKNLGKAVDSVSGKVNVKFLDASGEYSENNENDYALIPLTYPFIWSGYHRGKNDYTWCGFNYLPPKGSIVILGFTREKNPYILGYLMPGSTTNKGLTLLQRYDILKPGEIKIQSFGGSYIYLKSDENNWDNTYVDDKKEDKINEQLADIEIVHTLNSKIILSSEQGQENGSINILHRSGAFIKIDNEGNILLANRITRPNFLTYQKDCEDIKNNDCKTIIEEKKLNQSEYILITQGEIKIHTRTNEDIILGINKTGVSNKQGVSIGGENKNLVGKAPENILFQAEQNFACNTVKGEVKIKSAKDIVNDTLLGTHKITAMNIEHKSTLNTTIASKLKVSIKAGEDIPGMWESGIVTASTFCPILGFHVGAVGNLVTSSCLPGPGGTAAPVK